MRICVLSSGSFEKNYASYHLMRDLISYFLEDGNAVSLIQKSYTGECVLPAGLQEQKQLVVHSVLCRQAEKSNIIGRMLADIQYYLRTVKFIKQEKQCDVFFLQSNNCPYVPIFLIRLFTGKPVVYNVQDIFPQNAAISGLVSEKSFVYRVLRWLQRWALKRADGIVTISQDMKNTLVTAGAQEAKITVAYNWENEERGSQIEKEEDGKFHVVYAGNIGMVQNVELIVEAARLLQDEAHIQFDIYGSGARKKLCQEKAEGLKNIRFYEPVAAEQAYSLYQNADVNLVPLAKGIIYTALPSKTAACLRCGKPVIFCIDADSEFAKMLRENGIPVTSPTDAGDLAEEIQNRANKPGYGKNGKELTKLFSPETALHIYGETVRKTQNR